MVKKAVFKSGQISVRKFVCLVSCIVFVHLRPAKSQFTEGNEVNFLTVDKIVCLCGRQNSRQNIKGEVSREPSVLTIKKT